MKIVRGPHKGKVGRVHQFANDWMTVEAEGVPDNAVISPTQVVLTASEVAGMERAPGSHVGTFWTEHRVVDSGDPDYPKRLSRVERYR